MFATQLELDLLVEAQLDLTAAPAPVAPAVNVVTAHGNVHHLTVGRAYKSQGYAYANVEGQAWGKADCGVHVSTAAEFTAAELTCGKCIARASA